MVTIKASVQNQGPFNFNIEANGNNNVAWSTNCIQRVNSTTAAGCSSSPTFVSESINEASLNGAGSAFSLIQGGFEQSGTIYNGDLTLYLSNTAGSAETAVMNTYVANSIVNDAWNFGDPVSAGSVALTANS